MTARARPSGYVATMAKIDAAPLPIAFKLPDCQTDDNIQAAFPLFEQSVHTDVMHCVEDSIKLYV